MKKYKFTINEKDYNVVIKDVDDDVAELEVNGTPYSISFTSKKHLKLQSLFAKKFRTNREKTKWLRN